MNGTMPVAGMAFAGDSRDSESRGKYDEGATWKIAKIKDPLSQYTWVFWNAELDLTGNNHKIVVRVTDKTGKIQTDQIQDPFPNGATGYHTIDV